MGQSAWWGFPLVVFSHFSDRRGSLGEQLVQETLFLDEKVI